MYTPFSQIGPLEVFGFFLITLAVIFGNAAGVGGAGIIVPVLLLVFSFDLFQAAALSNFMIFLGFLIRYAYSVKSRHPHKNKPLIDYDTVCLMTPAALFGTKIGIIIHNTFPRPILLILLTIVLLYLACRMFIQGRKLSKRVQESKRTDSKPVVVQITEANNSNSRNKQEIDAIIKNEARSIPPKQAIPILILFGLLILSMLIEGSKGLPSVFGFKVCSSEFWASILSFGFCCFLVTLFIGRDCISRYNTKKLLLPAQAVDEVQWTPGKITLYSAYGLLAGILSATFGLGGGMILSPVLVHLKLLPEVVSATSGLFVLLTTAASSSLLIAGGHWPVYYGLLTGALSVVGAFVSIYLVAGMIRKHNRQYITLYIIAGVILASGITISSVGFYQDSLKFGSLGEPELWKFRSYCYQFNIYKPY
eukprot:TRINITY_DN3943_c0_g1_i3.p1 TRINITY_DN3943_c0_g1~~TRINITY_DN3943_c0_g1_i3.p1  ORF type:complete len:421 (-),score=-10.77 TRINITY_DN3943_c0_g1_i3:190-1452(-)